MSNTNTTNTEANAVQAVRKIKDVREYVISGIKLAKKYEIKQQKHIDRGVGIGCIKEEYRFLGYLEGKRSHLESILRLIS
jgi:hypothetical protein